MSLTDLMSSMKLTVWPEVALVIFLGAFFAIAMRTFGARHRAEQDEAGLLPLQDDASPREIRGEG